MKELLLLKNDNYKYIFIKTMFLSIVLNFSLYIYLPYVMDIFFNLNYHYIPILEANGRNLRIVLDNLVSYLFNPFLVPYFSLIISSIIYAYSFVMLYGFFEIESDVLKKLFPYLIILPCFTMLNPFYHDLPYYSFNFVLSILSVLILIRFKSNFKYILFVLISIFTLFIYQLNFFFVTSLLFFDIIRDLLENKNIKIIRNSIIKYFLSLVSVIVLYFLLVKLCKLSINTRDAGFSLFNFFKTYAAFLILPLKSYMQINELLLARISILIIYLIIAYLIFKIVICDKYNTKLKLLFILLIDLFPIAMNCVLLILKNPSRAMFAEIYLLIAPCFLIKHCYDDNSSIKEKSVVSNLFIIAIIFIIISNFYTANARYLELKNRCDSEKAWTIELVSAIRQTEGYNNNTKIAFLTKTTGNIENENLFDFYEDYNHDRFGTEYASSILKYNYGSGLDLALNYYGAFKYNKATKEDMELVLNNDDVKKMPIYPNYGATKKINDILVVKFY